MAFAIKEIINHCQLRPHPEGGYFKETYRSNSVLATECLPKDFHGSRSVCTGIP